jgi:nitrate/nitrite transporter NarK
VSHMIMDPSWVLMLRSGLRARRSVMISRWIVTMLTSLSAPEVTSLTKRVHSLISLVGFLPVSVRRGGGARPYSCSSAHWASSSEIKPEAAGAMVGKQGAARAIGGFLRVAIFRRICTSVYSTRD